MPAFVVFMDAQEQHVYTRLKARYFTLGKLQQETPAIWLVCHGYGQLAPYFIRHFQPLADAGHFVIAPEGLSRFYLEGFRGRVGASWMTKEDRQSDIDNYVQYLSAVYSAATEGFSTIPLHLLGFSQGVATISRWATLSGISFRQLVLWAGVFPPDLPLDLSAAALANCKVSVVYGTRDPFLEQARIDEQLLLLKNMNLQPEIISYNGKHEISGAVLKSYFI